MYELIRDFWWLVFPLSWMVSSAYQSWLKYSARRDTMEALQAYAAAGREPPAELVAKLNVR